MKSYGKKNHFLVDAKSEEAFCLNCGYICEKLVSESSSIFFCDNLDCDNTHMTKLVQGTWKEHPHKDIYDEIVIQDLICEGFFKKSGHWVIPFQPSGQLLTMPTAHQSENHI